MEQTRRPRPGPKVAHARAVRAAEEGPLAPVDRHTDVIRLGIAEAGHPHEAQHPTAGQVQPVSGQIHIGIRLVEGYAQHAHGGFPVEGPAAAISQAQEKHAGGAAVYVVRCEYLARLQAPDVRAAIPIERRLGAEDQRHPIWRPVTPSAHRGP
eukprot:CAMPEP_0198585694 /NCGR_PEP_ID=MMETSP1462-20131121/129636_1 /TAXON_ID=1333877 /ORGANISM="Brandtodinium nutriculum, Strain RCC3387" /LENGTH=152 /DNA_ID=CAMNT_0044317135 /DNA_START=310 /DNA_END=764 /DNA_ORIENTATION=-